jgi:hypothetical protein
MQAAQLMKQPMRKAGKMARQGGGKFERIVMVYLVRQRLDVTKPIDSNKKRDQTKVLSMRSAGCGGLPWAKEC